MSSSISKTYNITVSPSGQSCSFSYDQKLPVSSSVQQRLEEYIEALFREQNINNESFNITIKDGKISDSKKKALSLNFQRIDKSSETYKKIERIVADTFFAGKAVEAANTQKISEISRIQKSTPQIKIEHVALLVLLTIGFLSLCIGIGGGLHSLFNIHQFQAALPSNIGNFLKGYGIAGIPTFVSVPLIGVGLASYVGYKQLKARKDEKTEKLLKGTSHLTNVTLLPSLLNDATYGLLLLCCVIPMLHSPILMGSLAFPAGALFIGSGIMQGKDAKAMFNSATAIKDRQSQIKGAINVLYATTLIAIGVITLMGLINGPAPFLANTAAGALGLISPVWSLMVAGKKLLKMNSVDGKNPKQINKFLEENLLISAEEQHQIDEKIQKMKKDDLVKWIKQRIKLFEGDKKAKWQQILNDIQESKEEDDFEIRRLMKNEEIYELMNKKRSEFCDVLDKDTIEKALKHVDGTKMLADDKLKELFATIKSKTLKKFIYEGVKTTVLYAPLLFCPLFAKSLGSRVYDILFSILMLTSIGFNCDPINRNVPMADDEQSIEDINEHLELYSQKYAKIKKLEEEPKSETYSEWIKPLKA
ncbi:MAG: hypothetical protein JXA16_13800 [Bacteroidales bacterium]|nr:hypothetical protein [Bacteroidales bacterium]